MAVCCVLVGWLVFWLYFCISHIWRNYSLYWSLLIHGEIKTRLSWLLFLYSLATEPSESNQNMDVGSVPGWVTAESSHPMVFYAFPPHISKWLCYSFLESKLLHLEKMLWRGRNEVFPTWSPLTRLLQENATHFFRQHVEIHCVP